MKKVVNKTKAIIIAFMTMATVVANPVFAGVKADPPGVQIKYLGFRESNPVFEIAFNSNESDTYFITIKDQSGEILFSEKVSGKTMSRKYRIDTEEEIESGGLRFEVTSLKKKKTDVYLAGTTQIVIKDMAVNKIQ